MEEESIVSARSSTALADDGYVADCETKERRAIVPCRKLARRKAAKCLPPKCASIRCKYPRRRRPRARLDSDCSWIQRVYSNTPMAFVAGSNEASSSALPLAEPTPTLPIVENITDLHTRSSLLDADGNASLACISLDTMNANKKYLAEAFDSDSAVSQYSSDSSEETRENMMQEQQALNLMTTVSNLMTDSQEARAEYRLYQRNSGDAIG